MFDACTRGETAHIDTIFKFLPHTHQHVDACVARTWISYQVCHVTHGGHIEYLWLSKKTFSVFLWLWKIPLR